jgi:hypothetical protein
MTGAELAFYYSLMVTTGDDLPSLPMFNRDLRWLEGRVIARSSSQLLGWIQ